MQYAALVHKPRHTVARPTAIFWAQLCMTEQEWSVFASSGPEWSAGLCSHSSKQSVITADYLPEVSGNVFLPFFCCLDVSNESTSSRG